jgi:hypothetical protein
MWWIQVLFHDNLQQQAISSCLPSVQIISSACPLPCVYSCASGFMVSNEHEQWNSQAGSITLNPSPNKSMAWHHNTRKNSQMCHQQGKSWLQVFGMRKVLFLQNSCTGHQQ